MGMGRAVQNNNMTGMQGKGGAARPAPQPARPVQQPVAGMGAKGVGQFPPQQPPQTGMGAKGVGQFPPQTQQPGMPNFAQPYMPPQTGMGAKGVGQFPPQTYPFPQPTVQQQLPQTGMGAKGVGQFPPQTQQPGMPNFVQPYFQDMLGQMQSQQQLPQTGMAGKGVGTPAPVQQPRMYTNSYDDFPMINRTQPNSAPVLSPQEQDLAARQAFEAMQAQRQVQQPAPVPVQPLRQPARPAPVAARPNPLRTPVPVRPEPKNVANQRALQQLAKKAKR